MRALDDPWAGTLDWEDWRSRCERVDGSHPVFERDRARSHLLGRGHREKALQWCVFRVEQFLRAVRFQSREDLSRARVEAFLQRPWIHFVNRMAACTSF